MKMLLGVLASLCLAVDGHGQYLETMIPVGNLPAAVLWNPVSNKVYVANTESYSVTIIDGATNAVIRDIPAPTNSYLSSLCWNSVENKVYCTSGDPDWLSVIDGVGDTLLRRVRMRGYPTKMDFNATMNKLYVLCYDDQAVRVYDGTTDTLMAEVSLGTTPGGLSWHPGSNRLFCPASWNGATDTVMVIDCVRDEIVERLPVGPCPGPARWNPANGLVYLGTRRGIEVLSATGDTVMNVIPAFAGEMCFAPFPDKMYAATTYCTYVIDCEQQAVVESLLCPAYATACDTVHGKVYNAARPSAFVIDARADSLVTTVPLPGSAAPRSIAWNSIDSRVYIADDGADVIYVIRDTTTAIAEEAAGAEMGHRQTATLVRGVLRVAEATSRKPQAPSWLLDIGGRRVMELQAGANDVSRIPPGVYFVREAQAQAQARAGRKMVVLN